MSEAIRYPPAFDPRRVPLLPDPSNEALSAPAPHRLTARGLRELFSDPPPWEPELRREKPFVQRSLAQAAVLMLVVLRERPALVLTQRASHLSVHSGQIAFPGGKLEDSDADAVSAALRETQEEIGLASHHVEVLGTLPSYTTGSLFIVTPVVGLAQPGLVLQPNPNEVDEVFEVPLDFLMNPANHRRHRLDWEGVQRDWYAVHYQDGLRERFIWGATAGMLRNFYRLLSA